MMNKLVLALILTAMPAYSRDINTAESAVLKRTNPNSGYFVWKDKRQVISYIKLKDEKEHIQFQLAFSTNKSSVAEEIEPEVLIPSTSLVKCTLRNGGFDENVQSYYISSSLTSNNLSDYVMEVVADFCNTYRRVWVRELLPKK